MTIPTACPGRNKFAFRDSSRRARVLARRLSRSGDVWVLTSASGPVLPDGGFSILPWTLADLLEVSSGLDSLSMAEATRDIVLSVSDEVFTTDSLVRWMSRSFDETKIVQFLQKVLEPDIMRLVAEIEVVRTHIGEGPGGEPPVLFLPKSLAFAAVVRHAETRGVRVRPYRDHANSLTMMMLRRAKGRLSAVTRRRVGNAEHKRKTAMSMSVDGATLMTRPTPRALHRADENRVGVWYSGRGTGVDPAVRTDLFWLLEAQDVRERAVMFFSPDGAVAPSDSRELLARAGVDAVAMSRGAMGESGIPLWRPGKIRTRVWRASAIRLGFGILMSTLRAHPSHPFVLAYLADFVRTYAYWYDFFSSTGIRVNFSQYDFTRPYIPANLALRDLGGVSITFQYSNLEFASVAMSASADVMLAFGPAYASNYEHNRSTNDWVVCTGYPTDLAFDVTRERAGELRHRLERAGARFVVTFFDENSSDVQMSPITNAEAAETYTAFLDWLEQDAGFGLVMKPKKPESLKARLGPVWDRLVAAIETGRCVLIAEGDRATVAYPCEAAQAADLAVGSLMGGTAALESSLAGTRTVFLDTHRSYSNPIYTTGRGEVVFETVEGLRTAVVDFREGPHAHPRLGDLSEWTRERVSLADGGAARRIGEYVSWLLEGLDEGIDPDEAIARANGHYADRWGAEYVIPSPRRVQDDLTVRSV